MPDQTYSLVWDLDVFFPGGSGSPEFAAFLDQLEQEVEQFSAAVQQARLAAKDAGGGGAGQAAVEELAALTERMQSILLKLHEADSFTECLAAENQNDRKAVQLSGRIAAMNAAYASALTRFDERLMQIPDAEWTALLKSEPLRRIAFPLDERRRLAKQKLPPEMESLIGDLAVDGYHGWGEAYNTAVSKMKIRYEEHGKGLELSAGQAANKLHSPDRKVRTNIFAEWERAWAETADYAADALNRLAGFRIQVYKHRGWESILKEPLDINRMSEQTLSVMWDVIEQNKPIFVQYLHRKAKLLGLERLSWHDVEAPLGGASREVSFDEAAKLIVESFRKFSPKMADLAQAAFENRWIEAEDRPGKRPGGFCTSFPIKKQTRIFMTYANTMSNVSTLAHELGHAYHQHVMNDLPALAQEYAMNVAETASTFAELIVSDAMLQQASSDEERLTLLEDKIQRSVAFFMNIHARFLFETSFYDERKQGLVSVERLNELMEQAQRRAFHNALAEYHPHFWASKLHFYLTSVPFYNFPYTFGYLFSSGIYAEAKRSGADFENRYIALLQDTGSMTVEELARNHLGVDLTQPEFWQAAVNLAVKDVEQFLAMTE